MFTMRSRPNKCKAQNGDSGIMLSCMCLGVDFPLPFFSTIVLLESGSVFFFWGGGSDGFLERRIPGREGSLERMGQCPECWISLFPCLGLCPVQQGKRFFVFPGGGTHARGKRIKRRPFASLPPGGKQGACREMNSMPTGSARIWRWLSKPMGPNLGCSVHHPF